MKVTENENKEIVKKIREGLEKTGGYYTTTGNRRQNYRKISAGIQNAYRQRSRLIQLKGVNFTSGCK